MECLCTQKNISKRRSAYSNRTVKLRSHRRMRGRSRTLFWTCTNIYWRRKMPPWKKKHNYALFHTRRAYSFTDIAATLGIHVRTVQSWHKEGLTALDETTKPLLFMGTEIRRFLKGRRRVYGPLKDNEFICLTCKGIRHAKEGTSTTTNTRRRSKSGLPQTHTRAVCATCGNRLSRFSMAESNAVPVPSLNTGLEKISPLNHLHNPRRAYEEHGIQK